MTPHEALLKSAEHWLDIYDSIEKDLPCRVNVTSSACACCSQWYSIQNKCAGCPIREYVGEAWCVNTPYVAAAARIQQWQSNPSLKKETLAAAAAEYRFLVHLALEIYNV